MIYLHTLGDAMIKVGEKEIRPTAPLVFAALLYLCVERGRRVPRAALQELLFPNSDERSGAHSLRQLLYKLRQLGVPVRADSSSASIPRDLVAEDRALLTLPLSDDNLARLRGDILTCQQTRFPEPFVEWLVLQREKIASDARDALIDNVRFHRERLDWKQVAISAEVLLASDPLHEEAVIALAEALAAIGLRRNALAVVDTFTREASPVDRSDKLKRLRDRISSFDPGLNRSRGVAFVGRESDTEVVAHQFSKLRAGQSSLLSVFGEAGIGKTRLVEEACIGGRLQGCNIQVVRCTPVFSARPMSVFLELAPRLLACRGALGVSPQSLSIIQLLVSHDDAADLPVDLLAANDRSDVLKSALRDLIGCVATEAPLVLVIDDAHYADSESLKELAAIVRGAADGAICLLVTTRQRELFRDLRVEDNVTWHRLTPLSAESISALARELLIRHPTVTLTTEILVWIVDSAAGNPLFVQTLCDHYARTREPFSIPNDLLSAIRRRVERLDGRSRRVLEFAVVLGKHCTLSALQSASALSEHDFLESVQQLEDDGLLRVGETGPRVSHELLGECTLSLILPLTRNLLHQRVAAHLEARFDSDHDAVLLWDCAEHWCSSGDTAKALAFVKKCARHAAKIGQVAQALTILERAREFTRSSTELSGLLGDMMVAAKAAGLWIEAYRIAQEFERLLPLPRDHDERELLCIEAKWAAKLEADVASLSRCMNALDAPSAHRLEAAELLLRVAHERLDEGLAKQAFESVSPLLNQNGSTYAELVIPLIYHISFGDKRVGLAIARSLRSGLKVLESIGDQLRMASNVAIAMNLAGQHEESFQMCREYAGRTAEGQRTWHYSFCSSACSALMNLERFEEAQDWYNQAERTRPPTLTSPLDRGHVSTALELALWNRNADRVSSLLASIEPGQLGDSLRANAYITTVELRLRQLDVSYRCDDETITQLLTLYQQVKKTIPDLAPALAEALIRNDDFYRAKDLIEDYLAVARSSSLCIPSSLRDVQARAMEKLVSSSD